MPNCGKAVDLAETGAERPLSALEKVALRYHGQLCPFCGCAEGKFTGAMEKYQAAEAARQASHSAR